MKHARALRASFALCAGLLVSSLATAQTATPSSMTASLSLDSGWVANKGAEPETVSVLHVFERDTPWMRLFFSEVTLSGDVEAGTGSVLRLTSLLDGAVQLLDAKTVLEWHNSSAYFNGDLVQIEIIAHPGTGPNRVVLDRAVVGFTPAGEDTICGNTDDRVLSNDPRSARLLPIGCTGFMIDDNCGCFLTAGHCSSGSNVVEFNVPLSNANTSLNHPSPSDQYSVDGSSKQATNGGQGNDWGYFGVFPNSTTGLTPKQAQGSVYTFASPPPTWSAGLEVRITGYGVDSGNRNQVQQTHKGPWVQYTGGTTLRYATDTQGGNSGSAVIQEQAGVVMGIHTHGGCSSSGGSNAGTSSSHANLVNALANPKGVCNKPAPPTCSTEPTTTVRNGSGVNPVCLTNISPPILGKTWQYQVDPSAVAGGQFSVVRAHVGTASGSIGPLGELLLNFSSRHLFATVRTGASAHLHSIQIPNSLELAGFTASMQAGIGASADITQLCNAIDFTVGCE